MAPFVGGPGPQWTRVLPVDYRVITAMTLLGRAARPAIYRLLLHVRRPLVCPYLANAHLLCANLPWCRPRLTPHRNVRLGAPLLAVLPLANSMAHLPLT